MTSEALDAPVRAQVRDLIGKEGLHPLARRLSLDPQLLTRVAAGAGVRQGTLLALALRLGLVEVQPRAIATTPVPTA